jgi:hypothetical protein
MQFMPTKYLRWLEIGTFVSGIIILGLSSQYSLAWGVTLGMALIGSGLGLGGAMAMASGELTLWRGRYGITQDRGLTARLFGMVLALIGGALLAFAAARLLGWDKQLGAFLADRPGYAMLPVGVVMTALGAANLSGAWNRRGSVLGIFQSLKNWTGGSFLVLLELALVVMGLYEWIAPEAFDSWINSIFGPLL